jgi:hypothetical protein
MISRRDAVLGAAVVGAAAIIPKGAVADDWLVCNGQVVSRSLYPGRRANLLLLRLP